MRTRCSGATWSRTRANTLDLAVAATRARTGVSHAGLPFAIRYFVLS